MNVDPEEFRRQFEELSDEGLLSIDRDELVDRARQHYDQELARRGLQARPPAGVDVAEMDEELVTAATFLFPDEAKVARTLLESASIRCYLCNEHTLSVVWTWAYALGGLRLMVPVSAVDEVREILDTTMPDEELASQDEAETQSGSIEEKEFSMTRTVDPNGRGRRLLLWSAVFFFGAPDPNYLRLFYF
jgi:hypothetical protein